jgi:hypothetical protein
MGSFQQRDSSRKYGTGDHPSSPNKAFAAERKKPCQLKSAVSRNSSSATHISILLGRVTQTVEVESSPFQLMRRENDSLPIKNPASYRDSAAVVEWLYLQKLNPMCSLNHELAATGSIRWPSAM